MVFENLFRKKPEPEEEEPDFEPIEVIKPKRTNLEEAIYSYLTTEFKATDKTGLQTSKGPSSPPIAILHSEEGVFSVWHRLGIRGESGVMHLPDFIIYKGTHRIAPREKNPDYIIECRELSDERSNRMDTRVVRDVVGISVDSLPGLSVLVTNRPISEFAKSLATQYGIGLINSKQSDAGFDLFKMIVGVDSQTRDRIYSMFDKGILKLETVFKERKIKKKAKATSSAPVKAGSGGELRDLVVKALSTRPQNLKEIADVLKTNENIVLNQVYSLEKEGRIKTDRRQRVIDEKLRIWQIANSE